MASIKVVLWKHDKKKDGRLPLAIRITQNRKTRYIFTGEYIHQKDWDAKNSRVKKSHKTSIRLNNFLIRKLSEAHNTVLEIKTNNDSLTTKQIKQKVLRKNDEVSFFELAEQRIKQKHDAGVFSVSRAEQSIFNNIRKFHKSDNLNFREITTGFLDKFKVFCKSRRGQSKRTITNQLIFIRTLFNIAIKEGLVEHKHYPFAGEKEKIRIISGHKIGLTMKEVGRIEDLDLEKNTTIWDAKNVWLFAFYFAGIRISDVLQLKWSDLKDNRLYYVMNKNEKPLSLKIPERAQQILDEYRTGKELKKDFIFPYLKKANQKDIKDVFIKTRNGSQLINKYLKRIANQCEIDKNLSNHIARHSFGNIAGDAINPLMLQKLYRHSNLKTTIGYQSNFIHKNADDALDKVLGMGK